MAFDFLGGGSPGYAGGWFGGRGGGQGPNIFGDLNPRTIALFAMADRLAEAGKPQPYKTSTLGALPGAVLAGFQGYGATKRSNLQTQAAELQLQELQRQAEQRKQEQAALERMFTPQQPVPMQPSPGEPGTTTPYNGPGATYNPGDFPAYPAAPGQVTPYSGPGAQITPGPVGDPTAMLQQIQQRGQPPAPAQPTGIAAAFASLPPELQQYARVNPEFAKSLLQAYAQKTFKSNDPIKVGAGETLLDPNTRQPIFTGPTADKALSGDLAMIAAIYPPGSPQYIAEVKKMLDAKQEAAFGRAQYGLQPIYGVDESGNPVMMQTNNRGGVSPVQLPPGVKINKEPIKIDAGTHTILLDPLTRQQIGAIPKNVAATAAAREAGGAEGTAIAGAPNAVTSGELALKNIEAVETHPAIGLGTGITSWTSAIPGTPMYDFGQRVEQLQGQAFLEAFKSLKGAGAITETEGTKATQAIARLKTAQSEKDFKAALSDLKEIVNIGLAKARTRVQQGGQLQVPGMPPDAPKSAAPNGAAKTIRYDAQGNRL